jgi:hypothetical protein
MISTGRLFVLSLLLVAFAGLLALTGASAHAAVAYTVSVAPAQASTPAGGTAVFVVRVEGQTSNLPSFNYDVDGGDLAGVGSLDPTATNVAEGTVFVTRADAGTVTLNVSFGGQLLASGQAHFAAMGAINVSVTLNAGADAAARSWRFEVLSSSGEVVATLSAFTSGDAPTFNVASQPLPYGSYRVRQVLGSDTRLACAAGTFYAVAQPAGGETEIVLAAANATASFVITPCPDLPKDMAVNIPIDTIASGGVVGGPDVLPGETPISEVRGARQAGPLAPAAGNSPSVRDAAADGASNLLLLGALLTLLPGAGLLLVARRVRETR